MSNNSGAGSGTGTGRTQETRNPDSQTQKRDYKQEKLLQNSTFMVFVANLGQKHSLEDLAQLGGVSAELFKPVYFDKFVAPALLTALQDPAVMDLIEDKGGLSSEQIEGYIVYEFGDIAAHSYFEAVIPLDPMTARDTGIDIWQAALNKPAIFQQLTKRTALKDDVVRQCIKRQIERLRNATPAAKARSQSTGLS